MKLIAFTHCQIHVTLMVDIFKVMGSDFKVTDNIFKKVLYGGGIPIDDWPSQTV